MASGYVYLAMAVYVIIGFGMAYLARKGLSAGMSDYFLAGRTVGSVVSALTYSATTYSAFMMVGLAGFTYAGGVGALGFELVYLSGLSLAVFFGPRFWLVGKKFGYISPVELLGDRYDSKVLGIVAAVACCIFLIPYSAVQLMGVGYLMAGLSDGAIPFMVGVFIATALAVTWAWTAGMRSVALTDSFQALVMFISAVVVLLVVVYKGLGGFSGLFHALETSYSEWLRVPGPGFFNLKAFIGLTLPWFFFCISNPQVSQRLFIPRSLVTMKRMITGFLVFGFIYTLVSVLWGFSARVLFPGLAKADMATPTLLGSGVVPPLLALVVMVGITAAAVSTIDSILLTLSSMVARDIYRGMKPGVSEERELLIGKFVVPVIAVLSLLFASRQMGLIATLSVASSAGLVVMVPAIFGAFFWKRGTAAGAITSIMAGGIVAFFLQFSGIKPLGHWPGVWSLATSLVLFFVISLLTRPPQKKAEVFLGYLHEATKKHGII